MDPATQTAPKDHSETRLASGPNGTSSLGGSREIASRLDSFMQNRNGGEKSDKKTELPLPPKKDEKTTTADKTKVDASKGTQPDKKTEAPKEGADTQKRGTDGLTKEEREQVVTFKTRAEKAEARVQELETKYKDGDATAKELAELRKLNEQRQADYDRNEREIAAIRLQGSKKYQETIAQPMQRLTERIEQIAKGCEIDPDAVFNAISMGDIVKRDQALQEFIEKMPPLTQDTFKQSVNALLDLEPKAQKLMSEAREAWQAYQLEEKQAKELESQQKRDTYKKADAEVRLLMQERLPALNDPEIAKRIDERAANFDLYTAPEDIVAMAARSAYAVREMQSVIDKRDEEISQLKASIERLSGEKIGPGSGSPSTHGEPSKLDGSSSGDRFNQFMSGRR